MLPALLGTGKLPRRCVASYAQTRVPAQPWSSMTADPTLSDLAADMIGRGVRRVHVLGWRDFADRDAGGSERHAHEFMSRFAAAGLDVTHRTSAAVGLDAEEQRGGYRVIRRG